MAQSLDSLASYLKEKPILLEELIKDGLSTEQIRLLDSKGCYPYEYTTSFETPLTRVLPFKLTEI